MTITRVSTYTGYQNASADLLRAQSRQFEAQGQVSTGRRASDLQGFGPDADILTAARTVQSRVNTFIDNAKTLTARLETQDLALTRTTEVIGSAREAVASAIASGRAPTLMKELDNWFSSAGQALNMKHDGRHLFGGTQVDTKPVMIDSLAELVAAVPAGPVDAVFLNDNSAPMSRLDESTTAVSGFLASDVGAEFFEILRDIKLYHDDPATGPLDGPLSADKEAYLRTQLVRLDEANRNAIQVTSENGLLQNRVQDAMDAQQARSVTLEGFLGEVTDVDMAEAATRLTAAQAALQASAFALQSLQKMSLLDLLR